MEEAIIDTITSGFNLKTKPVKNAPSREILTADDSEIGLVLASVWDKKVQKRYFDLLDFKSSRIYVHGGYHVTRIPPWIFILQSPDSVYVDPFSYENFRSFNV